MPGESHHIAEVQVGRSYGAICKDCGKRVKVNGGSGMNFHLLRCDRCGAERAFALDEWDQALVHNGCGGRFDSDAPAHCPRCKYPDHRQDYGEPEIMYD